MLIGVLRFADNIKAVARCRLRRVSAFVIAIIMCSQLSARAIVPAIAVAGVAAPAVISAFLAACGIYLYDKGQEGSADGTYGKVVELWGEFRDWYTQQFPSSPEPPTDFNGFVTLGGIYLSAKVFDLLSQFARWIKDKYSLGDNDDVNMGEGIGNYLIYGTSTYVGVTVDGNDVYITRLTDDTISLQFGVWLDGSRTFFCFASADGSVTPVGLEITVGNNGFGVSTQRRQYVYELLLLDYGHTNTYQVLDNIAVGIPVLSAYSNTPEVRQEIISGAGAGRDDVGVRTGVISIPQVIPDDAEAGGIYIPGVTDSTTPAEVEEIIEQSVITGEYPSIRPVPVEIQDGVTVTDNGVEPGAIVIGSAQVPVPVTAYQIPDLNTVFPFCIPWDIYRIFLALNAEPRAPVFSFTLNLGRAGIHAISVDLSPWDSVAAICRVGEYAVFVVGLWMVLYRKFG